MRSWKGTSVAKLKISKFSGEIEIDESCFGSKRVRGKRGRGAANKTPVLNFATLVTFQEHSFHRHLIHLMFVLSSVEPNFIAGKILTTKNLNEKYY